MENIRFEKTAATTMSAKLAHSTTSDHSLQNWRMGGHRQRTKFVLFTLALIGSAARARRFQPVYSAGARVALDRLLAAMPAAGHVSKGIMNCRLVHYRTEPEAVPVAVRALSRAGFQRGNTLGQGNSWRRAGSLSHASSFLKFARHAV